MINPMESGLTSHQRISKTTMFNELGDRWANRRRIINGSKTNLMELGETKYKELLKVYSEIVKSPWSVESFNTTKDKKDYEEMQDSEKKIYNRIIASLIFLESELINDYDSIKLYFSTPEAELVISALQHQTAYHTYALAYLVQTTASPSESDAIYNIWRTLDNMRKRNNVLNGKLMDFIDNPLAGKFLANLYTVAMIQKALVPIELSFIYSLCRKRKLPSTAEVLKRIQKDLDNHGTAIIQMLQEILKENPTLENNEFKRNMIDLTRDLANVETDFTQFLTEGAFLGISELMMAKFAQAQANKALKMLKIDVLFPGVGGHPIPWFESYSEVH